MPPGILAETTRLVPVSKLKEHPDNPRIGDVEAIKESIQANGFFAPLVVRKATDHVLAGNHRLKAARALGMKKVPVAYVDVDAKAAKKILLADNRSADLAGYDDDALRKLLGPIMDADDLLGTLWAESDVKALLAVSVTVDDHGPQEPGDGLNKKWNVKRGQLFKVGKHRLLCGDAEDESDVARLLDGEKPNICVTDPPYGVNYDANWRNEAAAKGQLSYAAMRTAVVSKDDVTDWSNAFRLFSGDVLYAFSPPGDLLIESGAAVQASGFEIRAGLVWVKPNFPISRGHYTYQHEPIWYAVRKGGKAHWIGGKDAAHSSSVWAESLDANVEGGHSVQKPVALFERAIRNHEGDVYDPFAGSGTCLMAAHRMGRRSYSMEIEPGYVAAILERCEKAGMGVQKC